MLESPNLIERESLVSALREQVQVLEKASEGSEKNGNTGSRILLERIKTS